MMSERPDYVRFVRHNERAGEWQVIERSYVAVRGDGETVMGRYDDAYPTSKNAAERYRDWLDGWSLEECDERAQEKQQ